MNMLYAENNNPAQSNTKSPWYYSAVAASVIGAALSIIILSLLVVNYVRYRSGNIRMEAELESLNVELGQAPDDAETLVEEIRQLDLRFRQAKFRWLGFAKTGACLLLGGIAVFLAGAKCAARFTEKLPNLEPENGAAAEQVRHAARSRWSVIAVLGLIVAAALVLLLLPHVEFDRSDDTVAYYPTAQEILNNWHRFRGPEGAGITTDANIPDDWDGKSARAILWKTKVPVVGHNSPVVWKDRVFLSGGDPNFLQVFAFDALSGELLWTGDVKRTLPRSEDEEYEVMEDTGYAASTLATDGTRVYAIFLTGDLACFDFAGRKLWQKSLGIPDNMYGYASSLEVYRNRVLVQFDQGDAESGKSRLLAFDGPSGKLVWQAKRPVANSWSTPIVASTPTGSQIITAADPNVMAFDPNTGNEIWSAEGLAGDIAPSPVYANGHAFFIEPYSKIVAVRTDGKGDVTRTHIAWSLDEPGPDICSPVSNGQYLFVLNSDGLALCFNVNDGNKIWEEDIREDFLASPSLVNGKLYLLTVKGTMIIAEPMPKYKELKRCELGEVCHASPAFADGRIYIRTVENLYCIGKPKPGAP